MRTAIATYINNFVYDNDIQPADAIVVRKDWFGILNHYVIYLGQYDGEHLFIANYFGGVQIVALNDLQQFLQYYSPVKINKFIGDEYDRELAVERALSRLDENSYNLILNNCEHFANYVQTGVAQSKQTRKFGAGIAIGGMAIAGIASARGSNSGRNAGLAMGALGLLTLILDDLD